MSATHIRSATPEDTASIVQLCKDHAAYERVPFSESGPGAQPTAEALSAYLFQQSPRLGCLVVEQGGAIVGYTTYVLQESTWRARPYLFMDCLFLIESVRSQGIGSRIMDALRVKAKEFDCDQIHWQTPGFNTHAIRFYQRLGAISSIKNVFTWQIDSPTRSSPPASCDDLTEITGIPMSPRYQARPTRLSNVWDCDGWQMKVYQITSQGTSLPREVLDAGLEFLRDNVVWPSNATNRLGFVILHTGQDLLWMQSKIWVDDILRQFVFCSPLSKPAAFTHSPLPGFNECVWELEVTKHERDAWVNHVLSQTEPDFDAYLNDGLVIE